MIAFFSSDWDRHFTYLLGVGNCSKCAACFDSVVEPYKGSVTCYRSQDDDEIDKR